MISINVQEAMFKQGQEHKVLSFTLESRQSIELCVVNNELSRLIAQVLTNRVQPVEGLHTVSGNMVLFDLNFPFNEHLTLMENFRLFAMAKSYTDKWCHKAKEKINLLYQFDWKVCLNQQNKADKLLFKQLCYFYLPDTVLVIIDKAVFGSGEHRKIAQSIFDDLLSKGRVIILADQWLSTATETVKYKLVVEDDISRLEGV